MRPGYRLKISRATRMRELADRIITAIAAVGGSAAFLDVLRCWLQRRHKAELLAALKAQMLAKIEAVTRV